MENYLVPSEDIQYLVLESNNNLNMILTGMTYLMEENNDKISMLENQTWFQRMSKTITGKNKMTQDEIVRNHDKINMYTTQAMAELFKQNCIDHEIMLCLGNKINELYESQIEIKQIIGAFAQKINVIGLAGFLLKYIKEYINLKVVWHLLAELCRSLI